MLGYVGKNCSLHLGATIFNIILEKRERGLGLGFRRAYLFCFSFCIWIILG